ncbi:MAG: DUF4157 domain-containing protein [Saprospiraceae bacterium]|nr:DUF4157 domain-containing protein [Saprospiraceae bacterium]
MKVAESKSSATAPLLQKKNAEQQTPFFQPEQAGSALDNSQPAFFSPKGNSSIQRKPFFIQPKLTIGQPGDQYEQEADRMADQVVQRLAENNNAAAAPPTPVSPGIQRQCADCEKEEQLQQKEEPGEEEQLRMKPIFESAAPPPDDDTVQRKCADCAAEEQEQPIQTKANSTNTPTASPSLESRLQATKGGGSPLPNAARTQMEGAFDADFSGVRVHTDSSAVQMNKELGAQAFTHGSDIYFNAGKFDTGSTSGQRLLGHELTHVGQQGGGINMCLPDLQKQDAQQVQDRLTQQGINLSDDDIDSINNQFPNGFHINEYLAYVQLIGPNYSSISKVPGFLISPTTPVQSQVEVFVFNIPTGKGRSILISSTAGQSILLDAGAGAAATSGSQPARALADHINNLLISGLVPAPQSIRISHLDADHFNAVTSVLNLQLMGNAVVQMTRQQMMRAMSSGRWQSMNIQINPGQSIVHINVTGTGIHVSREILGNMEITEFRSVSAHDALTTPGRRTYNKNNTSPVTLVRDLESNTTHVFTADAEGRLLSEVVNMIGENAMRRMLGGGGRNLASVEFPHHGGRVGGGVDARGMIRFLRLMFESSNGSANFFAQTSQQFSNTGSASLRFLDAAEINVERIMDSQTSGDSTARSYRGQTASTITVNTGQIQQILSVANNGGSRVMEAYRIRHQILSLLETMKPMQRAFTVLPGEHAQLGTALGNSVTEVEQHRTTLEAQLSRYWAALESASTAQGMRANTVNAQVETEVSNLGNTSRNINLEGIANSVNEIMRDVTLHGRIIINNLLLQQAASIRNMNELNRLRVEQTELISQLLPNARAALGRRVYNEQIRGAWQAVNSRWNARYAQRMTEHFGQQGANRLRSTEFRSAATTALSLQMQLNQLARQAEEGTLPRSPGGATTPLRSRAGAGFLALLELLRIGAELYDSYHTSQIASAQRRASEGLQGIRELNWWEGYSIRPYIKLVARHWFSGRYNIVNTGKADPYRIINNEVTENVPEYERVVIDDIANSDLLHVISIFYLELHTLQDWLNRMDHPESLGNRLSSSSNSWFFRTNNRWHIKLWSESEGRYMLYEKDAIQEPLNNLYNSLVANQNQELEMLRGEQGETGTQTIRDTAWVFGQDRIAYVFNSYGGSEEIDFDDIQPTFVEYQQGVYYDMYRHYEGKKIVRAADAKTYRRLSRYYWLRLGAQYLDAHGGGRYQYLEPNSLGLAYVDESSLTSQQTQANPVQPKMEENPPPLPVQENGLLENGSLPVSPVSSFNNGEQLSPNVRNQMQGALGADFSNVRVHDDNAAARMNQELGAEAFTSGKDVFFNEGKYDPTSPEGQGLLAHELTHTIQQGAVTPLSPAENQTNQQQGKSRNGASEQPEAEIAAPQNALSQPAQTEAVANRNSAETHTPSGIVPPETQSLENTSFTTLKPEIESIEKYTSDQVAAPIAEEKNEPEIAVGETEPEPEKEKSEQAAESSEAPIATPVEEFSSGAENATAESSASEDMPGEPSAPINETPVTTEEQDASIAPTPTGDLSELEAWSTAVSTSIEGIEAPSIGNAEERSGALRNTGAGVVSQNRARTPQAARDLQNRVPPAPQVEPQPLFEPVDDPTIQQSLQAVEAASNRPLPEQTMPALMPSPRNTMPRLGDTPALAQREQEQQQSLLEATQTSAPVPEQTQGQRQVDELRQRQAEPVQPQNQQAQSQPVTLRDEPQPTTPLPRNIRQDLSSVLANLLADPAGEARRMLEESRTNPAMPTSYGGRLQSAYPDLGNEMLPQLQEALGSRLRLVADQAGISASDLDTKIEQRRAELAQEQAAQTEDVGAAAAENAASLEQAGENQLNEISATRQAMDQQAQNQLEAANGGEDPTVIQAKRDRLVGRVNQVTGEQQARYEQARQRREQQINQVHGQQVQAYRATVQRDLNTIRAEPGFAELSQDTKMERERTITLWGAERENTLRSTIRQINIQATTWANEYKAHSNSVGEQAREVIRDWADEKLGETNGFWSRLFQRIRDWFAQTQSETAAWEAARASETRDALVGDFAILNQARTQAGEALDLAAIDAMQGISEEQRAVLRAYYSQAPGNRSSIVAVAAGLRMRMLQQHVPEITTRFEQELRDKPASDWRRLNDIAIGLNSGFAADRIARECRQAMFGGLTGWGTDEDRIFNALNGLSPFEGIVVRKCYSASYGGDDLDEDLDSELSGAELTRAQAQLSGDQTLADVATLHEAMHGGLTGWGTDESAIMSTLRGKSEEERQRIIEVYRQRYDTDLSAELSDEMSGLELDQTDALMEGDTARADAIALEDAMHGGWTGAGTDEAAIEGTYQRIRQDVEAQAQREGWNTAQMEAEIARRNQQVEASYNTRFGNNWRPGDESTLRQAFSSELSGPELDLANALADNDLARADAARIAYEAQGTFVTDDDVVNGVLERQYERALSEVRRDRWPQIERQLRQRAAAEGWDDYQYRAEERRLERQLELEARQLSRQYMNQLESSYNSRYQDWSRGQAGLRGVIEINMSGNDQEKARDLLRQGGYLSPAQQIHYAVQGAGTEEEAIRETLTGRSAEEIEEIRAEYRLLNPGEDMDERIADELSGRDDFDTQILLEGEPENADQEIDQRRRQTQWELDNSSGLVGREEHRLMLERMEALEEQYRIVNDPNISEEQRRAAIRQFRQRSGQVSNAVQGYRSQVDAVTDTLTSVVSVTVAIVTAVAITIATGGTAGPVMVALLASLAGTAGQVATKAILKGGAYGWEDMGVDLAVGAVDALAAVATAGIGARLLQMGRLAQMAKSTSMLQRVMASFIAEGGEAMVSSFPSALTGNLLNDQNWEHGNPFSNILLGTVMETGIGTMAGGSLSSFSALRNVNLPRTALSGLTPSGLGRNVEPNLRIGSALDGTGRQMPGSQAFGIGTSAGPAARNTGATILPQSALRQADPALLQGLPPNLQRSLPVLADPNLPSNTVQVHYDVDASGLITNIHMRVGPDASALDIRQHVQTVRSMQQFSGLSGRLQSLQRRMHQWMGIHGEPPPGSVGFEARLELEKLPHIIQHRMDLLGSGRLSREAAEEISDDIDNLMRQLQHHRRALAEMEAVPGRGFVAAKGNERYGGLKRSQMDTVEDALAPGRSSRNQEVFEAGPPPPFPPPKDHDYIRRHEEEEWDIQLRDNAPDGTPRYKYNPDTNRFEARSTVISWGESKARAASSYSTQLHLERNPIPNARRFEAALDRVANRQGWTPEDIGRIRSWGGVMLELRNRLAASGKRVPDNFFENLLVNLPANYSRTDYDAFRRALRQRVIDHVMTLPVSTQMAALEGFLGRLPRIQDELGIPRLDVASQGSFFSQYRRSRIDAQEGISNYPDAMVKMRDGRMADGAINVRRRLTEGAPPRGNYLVDDKSGLSAFSIEQARNYARHVRRGTLRTGDRAYNGVVYFFQTEAAAQGAFEQLQRNKLTKGIFVSYFDETGEMRWVY